MALTDLLWACPGCRGVGCLDGRRKSAYCSSCGTVYRRGRGAMILAEPPDGESRVRSAAEWLDRLPPLSDVVDPTRPVWYRDRVEVRSAAGTTPVRRKGEFLGRFARFGDARSGRLALEAAALVFQGDEGQEDRSRRWPLDSISCVQAGSSSLRVKILREPVISFRFPHGSVRFWEVLLQHALRRFYRETGRGEIREFQPRIVTR